MDLEFFKMDLDLWDCYKMDLNLWDCYKMDLDFFKMDLDLWDCYKMDLDLWDCSGTEKPCLMARETWKLTILELSASFMRAFVDSISLL